MMQRPANFADAAEKVAPFVSDWFGQVHEKARTADLADLNAAPFESGSLLLTPLSSADAKLAGLIAAHQLTHASFSSPRPWIDEGLAHFAQALYLEHEKGRQAALDYMGLHRSAFGAVEKQTTLPRSEDEVNRSLVNTTNEELYRSKAMYVWWMLRDMLGDAALKKALAAYHAEQDKEPSYMPQLDCCADPARSGMVFRRLGLPGPRPAGFQGGIGLSAQDAYQHLHRDHHGRQSGHGGRRGSGHREVCGRRGYEATRSARQE